MVVFDLDRYQQLFKELGYGDDNGAALLLRTQLLRAVKVELEKRKWSQKEAAEKLGVRQPRISEIQTLRIDKFSVELLIKYLHRLGKEVSFNIDDAQK
jgi:predicted XRE-type DNA-binding protein